ncbi:MAG: hypothetical protein DRQ08_09275, partial [Candidatus Latescibacterota bacterium]
MFLDRREQIVALALAAAFLVGSVVSLYRKGRRQAKLEVVEAVRPPPAKVDVNFATEEELEALPYIGPELARRIISYRRRKGPFRSADELLEVKGIGPKILERIRPFLEVRDEDIGRGGEGEEDAGAGKEGASHQGGR